jgi:hypothetical protein
MNNISKNSIGNAGEYYFASLLSARGFVATITLGRAERYDILAVSSKNKAYKFSVKTRNKADVKNFVLSKKDEEGGAKDFYYVFVRLNEFKKEPEFWVVPSKRVNYILKKSHAIWKKTRGKKGQKHGESSVRNFLVLVSKNAKIYYPFVSEREIQSYYKNISRIK